MLRCWFLFACIVLSLTVSPAPGLISSSTGPVQENPPLLDRSHPEGATTLPDPLPRGHLGEGTIHKIWVSSEDTRTLEQLRSSGALLRSYEYGRRVLMIVDEDLHEGGRTALARAPLAFADEENLIFFNGFVLDGTRPEELLSRLPANERLSDAGERLYPGASLYIVQFEGPVRDEWIDELESSGARIVQHAPMNAYVVQAHPAAATALESLYDQADHVQYVGVYEPAFRLHPLLREAAANQDNQPRRVTLQVVDGDRVRAVVDEISAMADEVLEVVKVGRYFNVRAVLHPVFFQTLAAHPRIFGLEPFGIRVTNDEAQGQIVAGNVSGSAPSGPNYLAWLAAVGFNSSQFGSFSVNVVDDAYSLTGHPDLPNSRVAFQANPTGQSGNQGGHGFLNAHIIGGFNSGTGSALEDANGYNYGLGIAPWAQVGVTAIFGPGGSSPSSWESSAYGNGARISSNSWAFQTGFGAPIPDYDSNSQEYDELTRDAQSGVGGNQELLVLFAAGNDGSSSNTVSTPSTAKNIITVGASENWRQTGTDGCAVGNSGANNLNDIIGFSSRGPINSTGGDGRWKPEIVAPGTHVQAGVPQSSYSGSSVCNAYWPSGQTLYGWSSGTSHSTPALAGGAALVYQDFLNDGLGAPSPAMIKAVLVNSAEYMTGVGANDTLPSNSQGMGLMDMGRAFDNEARILVDQTELLSGTGGSYSVSGNVNNSSAPFRVTLVWTDAPGSTTGAPWVNDLNLEVTVGGTTYRGNVFSGSGSTTGGSADIRNNTESVFLPAGTSGSFTVTVDAASIAGDGVPGNGDGTDQDFALVIYNGASGPVPPTANFSATPTSGLAPLSVAFTDTSSSATTWSWTFGDGATSTAQNPTHTYSSTGSYTVSLTVTDPLGSDTESKADYIQVIPPPTPGISDGSFEAQSAGSAPTTPWTIDFGTGHLVNPAGTSSDSGMPSDGTNWVEVDGESTNNASGPSNPGGAGTPPSGGAGISQTFFYAAGQSELSFDAAFLRNEAANSTYNDWMSVDITDGSTWVNLYYADTFTATPNTSARHGFAMTAVSNVTVELTALFPSSTPATEFTLRIQTGNAVDSIQPSIGYADNFTLSGAVPAPVASFTAAPTTGVEPLTVSFSDTSTGSITAYSWTFGDGGSSTLPSPSHTYGAGVYTATLTVTGPGGSDSASTTITALDLPPVAGFNASPTSGIAPLTVNFTDASTGNATAYAWTFGDGGSSSAQDPSHVYTTPGTYTASLTVTGPGGSDSASTTITVAEPAPVAGFSASPTAGVAPLTVNFTDASSGNITSRSWAFGDGGTSSATNPSHLYTVVGSYTATLTVTGPGGSDSSSVSITVNEPPPVAGIVATPTSGTAPLTVSFSDASTGAVTSHAWTFGDGDSSSLQNPSHTYASSGSYTATLTVTGPGGSDSASTTITVTAAPPVAGFTATPTSGEAPLTVGFTNASTGEITSYSWSFGDGGSSSQASPSHTYSAAGTYTATLTASGPGGSDSASTTITVNEPAPVAGFSASPTSGVAPLTVNFTDASSGNITSRSWAFGDGGTSSATNPSHLYTVVGSYTATLTVTGPGGSDSSSVSITVNEPPPVAGIVATPTSGTAPLTVSFSDASTGAVTSHAWTFGDGDSSSLQNPSHTYASSGSYTATLTVTGPGGSDSASTTITVTAAPPVAGFTATPTSGEAPLTVGFTNASTGEITSYSWSFGDGGSSSQASPSHTYSAAGTYTATLTASGPGGSDSASTTITVNEPAPVAGFSGSPTSGTVPLTVSFTDASSGAITGRSWSFGDGNSSSATSPAHTYNSVGTYTVSLTVSGPGGSDTETRVDYVTVSAISPPTASFSGSPTSGTAPLTVTFTDATTGSVSGWSWTFGDGGTSSAQNPSHTYAAAGTYTVSLTASGPGGSNTQTRLDYVTASPPAPTAGFAATPTTGTAPLTVAFTDSSSGSITSYSWTFGDGGTSSLQNPSHTYNAAGTYTASLTVTGAGGSDTASATITVNAPAPVASFTASPTSGIAPLSVSFTDTSSGTITARAWDFGDGGVSSASNPSHTYTSAGTYTVSLTVSGPGGSDTQTQAGLITVATPPPTAAFGATPTSGAAPLAVSFTDLSSGSITSRSWSFGDGGTSNAQNPSHTYTADGTYTVSLTVTGPGGSDTSTQSGLITVSSVADPVWYFTFTSNTVLPGGAGTVADDDVVSYDPSTGEWAVYFDGSDVGIGGTDINALHVRDDGNILMSFNKAFILDGPGTVDDSDIVLFTFSGAPGPNTSGTFSLFFDGSDIGFTRNGEDIDGLYELPNGDLAISTTGRLIAGGADIRDEDVGIFSGTTGPATSGSISLFFDGSDVALGGSGADDVDAVILDGDDLLFSSVGTFIGAGTTGADHDVARFVGNFGSATSGTATLELELEGLGIDLSEDVDGMSLLR